MGTADGAHRPRDVDVSATDNGGGRPSPLEDIGAVVRLLFEAGLALNSIQRSPMSEHDVGRTTAAIVALDEAVIRLRQLAVSLVRLDG